MKDWTSIWATLVVTHLLSCLCIDIFMAISEHRNNSKLYGLMALSVSYLGKRIFITLFNLFVAAPFVIRGIFMNWHFEERNDRIDACLLMDNAASCMLFVFGIKLLMVYMAGFIVFIKWFDYMHHKLHDYDILKHIHAVHHQASVPFAIDSLLMHPLEFVVVMVLGIVAGPLLVSFVIPFSIEIFQSYIAVSVFINAYIHAADDNHRAHHLKPRSLRHMSILKYE